MIKSQQTIIRNDTSSFTRTKIECRITRINKSNLWLMNECKKKRLNALSSLKLMKEESALLSLEIMLTFISETKCGSKIEITRSHQWKEKKIIKSLINALLLHRSMQSNKDSRFFKILWSKRKRIALLLKSILSDRN